MTRSIQDTWDRFERWVYRFNKVSNKVIDEMEACGYSDVADSLFLCKWFEIDTDIILDCDISKIELSTRLSEKVKFLRGYLVDISCDGPDFMKNHSSFLTQQYPSKCNNSMGIWLVQELEGECEAGSYFGFQGFDVSFFCKSLEEADLASMRNILPFDYMHIRQKKGINWDAASINNVVQQVKDDIEFDYTVKINIDNNDCKDLLSLNFIWE